MGQINCLDVIWVFTVQKQKWISDLIRSFPRLLLVLRVHGWSISALGQVRFPNRLSWWRGHNNARYRSSEDIYSPSFPTGANGNNLGILQKKRACIWERGSRENGVFPESGNWAGCGDQGGVGMKRMPPLLGKP